MTNLNNLNNQQQALREALYSWDAYLADIERIVGHPITEGPIIDMLYSLYLGDLTAQQAVGNMEGLQQASVGVQMALDSIKAAKSSRELEMAYRDVRVSIGWRGKGRLIRHVDGNPIMVMPRRRRRMPLWLWCGLVAAGWLLGAAAVAAAVAALEHFQ